MRKVLYLTAFGSVAAVAAAVSLMPWEPTSTAPKEPIRIPVVEYDPSWKCPTCTPEEKYVLEKLQENTKISDRNALATIMGNIKQESLTSVPTYAREGLEFLTTLAIGVGMVLFSGPQ